jgi:hypothetical protein
LIAGGTEGTTGGRVIVSALGNGVGRGLIFTGGAGGAGDIAVADGEAETAGATETAGAIVLEGDTRGGREGSGCRAVADGDAATDGIGVETGVAVGATVGASETDGLGVDTAVAVALGVGATVLAGVATGVETGVAVGATLGECETDGLGVDTTVAVAFGVAATVLAGVATGVGLAGAVVAAAVLAGVVTGTGVGGVAVAATVLAGAEVTGALSGFTKIFDGASAGGAASVRIFTRARSEADRSVSADQVFSTVDWVRVSLIVCGRSIPGTLLMTGACISRNSPRTVALESSLVVSVRRWRRKRSMG